MPIPGIKRRFGPFELDSRTGELRTNGTRIKLQGQPISVLQILLETPGELVTREQIRQRLWSSDTFVDFDHNLNTAIKKLRQALGDEAETPRYIETIPRYGYRFIGQVEKDAAPQAAVPEQESAETEPASAEPEVVSRSAWPQWLHAAAIALAALLLVALMLLAWRRAYWQTSVAQPTPVRSQLLLHINPESFWNLAVSPDGQYLAYVDESPMGTLRLMDFRNGAVEVDDSPMGTLRLMDLRKGTEETLPGTERAEVPFWSPDGRYIGFFSGDKLKKIALDSRVVSVIHQDQKVTGYASWGTQGIILVQTPGAPQAVSVDRGEVRDVFVQDKEVIDLAPSFLPDGKHFLFIRYPSRDLGAQFQGGPLYIGALDGGAPRSLNLRVTGPAEYRSGHLLYPTAHGLFAQRFDPDAGRLMGQPALLIEAENAAIDYTASNNGILLSRLEEQEAEITLYSRDGRPDPAPIAQAVVGDVRFSPDGARIAYVQRMGGSQDIWTHDLDRHVSHRITPSDGIYWGPVWSPDGKQLAYHYRRTDMHGLEIRNVDGSGSAQDFFEASSQDPVQYWPRSWSAQGDLLFITVAEVNGSRQIGVLSLDGDRKLHLLPNPNGISRLAERISPDGKWLAYTSRETGRTEVFVQPYPGPGQSIRVSVNGGNFPEWRKDGRELFFLASDGKVEAAPVSFAADGIKVGEPVELFAPARAMLTGIPFDADPDGKRFAIMSYSPLAQTVDVIVNWDAGLPQ
jgi:Tol biopolymer transport system component/DNA-binding winged helix-turn-helix (wHTH) protein